MKGEAQREKLSVAATELADAQADARVESLRDPMNNLTDRRAKRPWNAVMPEISAGSQHKAALQYAPARVSGTDMAQI